MNAEQFCAEYGYETKSGRVSFSKKTINKFIMTYTHFSPNDFNEEMRERLKISLMIDLYDRGIKNHFLNRNEDSEKIELSKFILTGKP